MLAILFLFTACALAQPLDEVKVAAITAFTEGPAVDAAGNIYFTETRNEKIMKLTPKRELTVFRENSNGANGLVFDRQGRLIACEGNPKNPRVTRTDIPTGKIEILAGAEKGIALTAPNDVTVDGKNRIYFTDMAPVGHGGVYRIDTDDKVTRILSGSEVQRPNGLMISPDDRTFYVVEANGLEGGARMIRAYDLSPAGTVSNMRVFHNFYPGRSADGMCIDTRGNLYAIAGLHMRRGTSETLDTKPGVHVFSPQGKLLRYIMIPEDTVTNCTFGGPDMKTLFVTAGKSLYEVAVDVPGTSR